MLPLENLLSYSFIIKGKVARGRRPSLSFLSRPHVSISSSSSMLSRGVFLSLCGQVRSTNYYYYYYYVCKEYVLGIINLLRSLGRMWVSCHHSFIVLGHFLLFYAFLAFFFFFFFFLLSKPACFCG